MKIYRYMKSLRLENVFFTQLILRLAAMVLGILASFLLHRYDLIFVNTLFCVLSFFSHFCIYYEWYSLNSNSNMVQISKISFLKNQIHNHPSSFFLIQYYLYGLLLDCLAWFYPTCSVSCFLMLAFFLLYTVNNSEFSKKEWFLLNHCIGGNIILFMENCNTCCCGTIRTWKRIFLGLSALATCLYFNIPVLGFAFVRFSSYSIIYHFSKCKYQYQNTSDSHSFIQKILYHVRWIVAFSSVCIVLPFPHLWAIPFITLHILESIEQQLSGFLQLSQDMEVMPS